MNASNIWRDFDCLSQLIIPKAIYAQLFLLPSVILYNIVNNHMSIIVSRGTYSNTSYNSSQGFMHWREPVMSLLLLITNSSHSDSQGNKEIGYLQNQ